MRPFFPRPALLAAMLVGAALRVLPLALWFGDGCQRDECTYKRIAAGLVAGRGLETEAGWLWAPGYPALIAASLGVFGHAHPLRYVQVALAVLAIAVIDRLATRVADARAGTIAAWAYALHPTLVYFAGTLWSEAVYGPLLLGAVLALLWARDGGWRRAVLPGLLIAGCVLFRGVAQYMAPIFAVGLLLPVDTEPWRDALRARWRHAAAMLAAVAIGVAPYSAYATRTYGGFVLSDATLGQMMWYGDNDFPPISFDWGSGLLADRGFESWTLRGRGRCDLKLPPAAWNACEVAAGRAWIAEHPLEFVRRVPMRVAQLLNPHTFLSRHMRLGRYPGLPFEIKEALALLVVAWSFVVLLPGTVAAAARARGPFGFVAVGVVTYHLAAVAVTAGLTRYRIPLEPLWLIFLAGALSRPRETWAALVGPRGIVAAALMGCLLPLWGWYLRSGFPGCDGKEAWSPCPARARRGIVLGSALGGGMIWALWFGCVAVSPSGDVLAPRRDAAGVAQTPPSAVAPGVAAPAGPPPAGTFDFDADARPAGEMGEDTDTDATAVADAALSVADAARGMGLPVPVAAPMPLSPMPSGAAFGAAGWGIRLVSTVADAQPPRAILGLSDGRELVVTPGTLLPDARLVVMAVGRDMVQIAEITAVGDHADVVSRTLTPMYPR